MRVIKNFTEASKMSARKFLAALILVILAASFSFAEITPSQILSDTRFSTHVPATKANGSSLLPGRYIVAENTASRTGGQPIIAPTKIIIEIGKFSSEIDGYPFNIDVHGMGSFGGRIILDTQAEAPIITFYTLKASGQYEPGLKSYAIAIQEEHNHAWLLGDVSDGKVSDPFSLLILTFANILGMATYFRTFVR